MTFRTFEILSTRQDVQGLRVRTLTVFPVKSYHREHSEGVRIKSKTVSTRTDFKSLDCHKERPLWAVSSTVSTRQGEVKKKASLGFSVSHSSG